MILKTKRLILRSWEENDAESLYLYAKDDRVGPICGWSPHQNVENSLFVITHFLKKPGIFAIVLKETNQVIGSIGITIGKESNLKIDEDEGEIGYWIGVPFWGRGLTPEALKEMIQYAFKTLKLKRLWCSYFDGNDQSKRVMEKCGFHFHHTNKDILWEKLNKIVTEHVYLLDNPLNSREILGE